MRVAIIGSRNCENLDEAAIMRRLPEGCSLIISGGANGVDTLAETVAKQKRILFEKILPDYEKYGKSAPLLRNKEIVERADLVLAFWDFQSRGTADTIVHCIHMQVPVEVYGLKDS